MKMEKLDEIAEEIRTQDNMATADPIFILFDKKTYPTDRDYSDEYMYFDWSNDCNEIEGTKEGLIDYCGDESFMPSDSESLDEDELFKIVKENTDIKKVYIFKVDVFKQVFFTKKSAEEYLKKNRYHFREPYIYCDCLYRNYEMQSVRNALIENRFKQESTIKTLGEW